ncbi:MFS transporter [Epidermidibacterium keratini]|uniref:MFS transporter n=1 Tax=Epidermidibacterium keratini TaxID=1891644 RepID=A0A7L4YUU7_9ACTN|nr:MFS transporter [Epidermidibacterium keratini]QHC02127.1 MFS transporter [Epidermidibacterium keratini]
MSERRLSAFPTTALWLIFFVNGGVLASWAPRVPEVKDSLALSDSALGAALFGVAAGSVPALLGTGWLLRYVSTRTLCVGAGTVFAAALPAIAMTTSGGTLAAVLTLLGAASGCLDVAMNTAAIEFERTASRRPVISRLHGGYSLGVLAGATGGAVATRLSMSVTDHFIVVSVILVALVAIATPQLPHTTLAGRPAPERNAPSSPWQATLGLPVAIAALAVGCLLVEGMITDWSALLISRDFDAGYGLGSAVVVAFSIAMFCSRSAGDWLVSRIGRTAVLYLSAGLTAAACLVGLTAPSVTGAVIAIVVIGCGLGPVFPLAISMAADRHPEAVASAAAAVSAVGYVAYLAGPPAIGLIAEHVGLKAAVVGIGTLCALVMAVCTRQLQLGAQPQAFGCGRH